MAKHYDPHKITEDNIVLFEKNHKQLQSFYREIGLISKKKPSEPLNKFKLGFINQVLVTVNQLLGEEYRPFPDFTTFDVEGSLPTASDVVMMLSQYLKVMDKYRSDHTHQSFVGGSYYWNLPAGKSAVEAKRPKKFDT
jgi:hypothetical protein